MAESFTTYQYGSNPNVHIGDLYLPEDKSVRPPVCMLLHGGFWKRKYTKDLMVGMAKDLAKHGIASWNVVSYILSLILNFIKL